MTKLSYKTLLQILKLNTFLKETNPEVFLKMFYFYTYKALFSKTKIRKGA